MARADVDATLQAALRRKQVTVIAMVYLDIENDPVRLHTDFGTINWGGNDWLGVGALGQIGQVQEDESLKPNQTELALSLNSMRYMADLKAAVDNNAYRNRRAVLYAAALDQLTGELIGNPTAILDGEMESINLRAGEGSGRASVTLIDGRTNLDRSINQNFSNDDQQTRHPGDLFSKFQASAVRWKEVWGPGGPAANTGRGGEGGGGRWGAPRHWR